MTELTAEQILKELNVTEDVLNIYPYGSRIYGTATEDSDSDFIIVTKGSFLKSGAFRQNAISSGDRGIQGVLYSRGGFIDAINNYEIGALECVSLDDSQVVKKTWPFRVQKWVEKEMVKKVITKASNSWHIADMQSRDDQKYAAKKGVFHALRILSFGLQLKEHQRVVDFACCNQLHAQINGVAEDDFDTRDYLAQRDALMERLRA